MPTDRFPRDDDGWRQAWARYVTLEPNHVAVPEDGAASPTPAPGDPATGATATGDRPRPRRSPRSATRRWSSTRTPARGTCSGYGRTFFGIWDRQNAATPVERFPRSDDGWAQAWRRYTQIENNFTEVH